LNKLKVHNFKGEYLKSVSKANVSMQPEIQLNRSRYRKVTWFFAQVFIHAIWWELLLRKIPLVNFYVKSSSMRRWRRITRRFRDLALEMGGVLIKLGQFLSIRVDILPAEVIKELADLQDEVPAEPIEAVIALIEADFGRPLAEIFTEFEHQTLAAASLAQTHRARLPDGQEVVVKVQRPGIDVLVHTDLASMSLALRWLKLYPRVAQRVNLDWLAEEFTTVTTRELDFVAEGENSERFATIFAQDPAIYVPKIYWNFSTGRVLTMENVAYIRLSDLTAMDEAGIDRAEMAKTLYANFLQQLFVTHFVHADPHPGNLFVRALPRPANLPANAPTPYQIIFIDFGMMAVIPERLWGALVNYAIGIGTRDAHRVVQSYVEANMLLPGADTKRLEDAHRAMFDRFWGADMTRMRDIALSGSSDLFEEYRDLIYDTPFQVQVDMLFALRGLGLVSGITTNLDSTFDPWTETIPFAERLARDQIQFDWPTILQQVIDLARMVTTLPNQVDEVLTTLRRGNLSVENILAPDTRRTIRGVEAAVDRLTWAIVFLGTLLTGLILRVYEQPNGLNSAILGLAGVIFVTKVLFRRSV
jgi:predicted unusual protein kinase regulating ubiquinone biosynthesis (AarF/ABC1/UbiB family)